MTDASLVALLAGDMAEGSQDQQEAAALLQSAADVVTALRAGPARDELGGEAAALAEFRSHAGRLGAARGARRRTPARRTSLVSARVATAAAIAVAGAGSVATAAYAGVLPPRIQRLAHATIGAPAAGGGSHQVALSRGGHPARTWCFALTHGTRAQRAAALRRLDKAEAGQVNDGGFCRAVRPRLHAKPGRWPVGQRRHPVVSRPVGRPVSHPPGGPAPFGGKPSPGPSRKPAPRPHARPPLRT
jgi:hypothetical protein